MSQQDPVDPHEPSTPRPQYKTMLDGASSTLGVLGAATLGLSVIYDFSYLTALGLDFGEVQTSISDHVRSALVWVPTMLAGVAFVVLWELLTRRIEGFQSEEEIIQASKDPERIRRLRRGPDRAMVWAACAVILYQFLLGTSKSAWYIIFSLGWLMVSMAAVSHHRLRSSFTLFTAVAFVLVPFVASGVGYLGFTHAERALKSPTAVWKIGLSGTDGKGDEEIDAALVRRFSSTAILVTAKGEIRVVPEALIRGAVKGKPTPEKSLWCSVTGRMCERPKAVIPEKPVKEGP